MPPRARTGPLHHQIATDLTRRITAGEFPAGTHLPPLDAVRDHYRGVFANPTLSTSSVRTAIAQLVDAGLVESTQGSGVRVLTAARTALVAGETSAIVLSSPLDTAAIDPHFSPPGDAEFSYLPDNPHLELDALTWNLEVAGTTSLDRRSKDWTAAVRALAHAVDTAGTDPLTVLYVPDPTTLTITDQWVTAHIPITRIATDLTTTSPDAYRHNPARCCTRKTLRTTIPADTIAAITTG